MANVPVASPAAPQAAGGGPSMEGFQAAMETAGYSDLARSSNSLNPNLGMRKSRALMGLRESGVMY